MNKILTKKFNVSKIHILLVIHKYFHKLDAHEVNKNNDILILNLL